MEKVAQNHDDDNNNGNNGSEGPVRGQGEGEGIVVGFVDGINIEVQHTVDCAIVPYFIETVPSPSDSSVSSTGSTASSISNLTVEFFQQNAINMDASLLEQNL